MYHIIYDFFGLNKEIFIFINKITNVGILPEILAIISNFFLYFIFVLYYFMICLYWYAKLKKLPNPQKEFTTIYNKLVKVGICYTLFGFTYAALKFGVNFPRPFCSLSPEEFTTIVHISGERCLSSFPSAHVGLSIMITYYIWVYLKNYQKIIAILLVLTVAISRITLAMHYPSDILYSIAIIFVLIFLTNKLFDFLYNKLIKPIGFTIFRVVF